MEIDEICTGDPVTEKDLEDFLKEHPEYDKNIFEKLNER